MPTKKQRKLLCEYVRWVADSLELRDWTIKVDYDKPPEVDDAVASIRCIYGRKLARIRLCADFFEHSPEEQRQTIAHELIHCHLSGIEWAYNNLGDQVSGPVFKMVFSGIVDQMEFATDAMADAVAKHLPLPKQAKEKKAA